MRSKRIGLFLVVVTLGLGVAGESAAASPGDPHRSVKAAVWALFDAASREDYETIGKLLGVDGAQVAMGERAVETWNGLARVTPHDVKLARVYPPYSGETVTAWGLVNVSFLIGDRESVYPFEAVQVGDKWLLGPPPLFAEVSGRYVFYVRRGGGPLDREDPAEWQLEVLTVRDWQCGNYEIRYGLSERDHTITIHLIDAYEPAVCRHTVEQATATIPLNIMDGEYVLEFADTGTNRARYRLTKENGRLDVEGESPWVILVDGERYRNRPRETVAAWCHTETPGLCFEFFELLESSGQFKAFDVGIIGPAQETYGRPPPYFEQKELHVEERYYDYSEAGAATVAEELLREFVARYLKEFGKNRESVVMLNVPGQLSTSSWDVARDLLRQNRRD